jgi:hypothetical protein
MGFDNFDFLAFIGSDMFILLVIGVKEFDFLNIILNGSLQWFQHTKERNSLQRLNFRAFSPTSRPSSKFNEQQRNRPRLLEARLQTNNTKNVKDGKREIHASEIHPIM